MRFSIRRARLPRLPAVESFAGSVQARLQHLKAVTNGAMHLNVSGELEDALRAEGILVDNYRPSHAFRPRRVVYNGTLQTVLSRRLPLDSLALRLEQPLLVDAGHDYTEAEPDKPVRLIGYYNPPLSAAGHRGLALLIHGWEGHSHASDLLFMADTLLRAGFSTFRLNVRDHGPNLHVDRLALNKGLFVGTLLEEIHAAAQQVALLAKGEPFYLVGGSMGGNFVLRMAERHNRDPIPNLAKVVALCPAVSPGASIDTIDRQPAYRAFFRTRWLASLKSKQRHFPDFYDFGDVLGLRRLREITDRAIPRYSSWQSADAYFAAYGFDNEAAANLRVPVAVIGAADDAVIPVRDLYMLEQHAFLKVAIHPVGGHMGFVDIFPYRRWLPHAVLEELRAP